MCDEEVTLEFIRQVAEEGAEIIKNCFNKEKNVSTKLSVADLVTETDVKIEKLLIQKIKSRFPTHSFLCEESAEVEDVLTDEPTWIIDPIDGTTNFVHSFPFTCISIAFLRKKEMKLGVVSNPIAEEEFYASKNGGAFLNDQRIFVSENKDLNSSLIAMGLAVSKIRKLSENLNEEESKKYQYIKDRSMNNLSVLSQSCRDIRVLGSCALQLSYIACGRLDAYVEFGCKQWDMAAGVLIVKEAGGHVSDVTGKDFDINFCRLIAANSKNVIQEIAQKIQI